MHILTVIDHPSSSSLTHAVAARFEAGAAQAGHTTERADLHAEGFDPRWNVTDAAQFDNGEVTPDIRTEQERIERCDALCLVFPLYWYGMPAMTKGWIDRVWSWGWAYDEITDPPRSLLSPRKGVLLVPAAANPANWESEGYGPSMKAIWGEGTLSFFGVSDPEVHFLTGSEGSPERRAALLERAFQAGAGF
ncbi:MAG: NAD(P)H-dependent oxidoreductase [Brevirhabdus sp.]